jgi:hypothetical protein
MSETESVARTEDQVHDDDYGSKNKMDFHTIHGISSCVIRTEIGDRFLKNHSGQTHKQTSIIRTIKKSKNMLLLPFVVF